MSRRGKLWIGGVIAAIVFSGTGIGIWLAVRSSAQSPVATDEVQGTATVTTVPLRVGAVSQTVTAYGDVTAEPGVVSILSVSVECRVRALHVAGGQSVTAGAPVVEIEPSPDVKLQLVDARNALASGMTDAANVQQRFKLKLAMTTEMQQAEQAVRAAQTKLDDLMNRGAGEDHRVLTADAAGIVAKVNVQAGQLVSAGGPLVELIPRGQIEVRLGVEPAEADSVRSGQPVQLTTTMAAGADETKPVDATVRLVTARVNPDSRLVDVFATPASTDRLLLDSFVRGELTVRKVSGLVVPHAALLPGANGFSIFVVADGKAVKHAVKVTLQNDAEAAVVGDGLHEGNAVVIAGSLELDDGTPVTIAPPTTAPATTEASK